MLELAESKATVSLDVLGGLEAAPAARHPLYNFCRLAVFVLTLKA
jgi:short-subunit dehydrogenase involved in D-alanine esterification of teichoic acids